MNSVLQAQQHLGNVPCRPRTMTNALQAQQSKAQNTVLYRQQQLLEKLSTLFYSPGHTKRLLAGGCKL